MEHNIISTQSNSPTHSWSSNEQKFSKLYRKPFKPWSQHICNTARWVNAKSKENSLPNKLCYMAVNKKMLDVFISIAKTAFSVPLSLSFDQVILCEDHTFFQVPQFFLIFIGTLNFQAAHLSGTLFSCIKHMYIDLTEKEELWFAFQTNWSSASTKFTWTTKATRLVHYLSLSPTKALLKEMFSGVLFRIDAISFSWQYCTNQETDSWEVYAPPTSLPKILHALHFWQQTSL